MGKATAVAKNFLPWPSPGNHLGGVGEPVPQNNPKPIHYFVYWGTTVNGAVNKTSGQNATPIDLVSFYAVNTTGALTTRHGDTFELPGSSPVYTVLHNISFTLPTPSYMHETTGQVYKYVWNPLPDIGNANFVDRKTTSGLHPLYRRLTSSLYRLPTDR